MQTQSVENIQSNVVQLEAVKKSRQNPKLKAEGVDKQTPNNNSIDRWVHPIREKSDVKKCFYYSLIFGKYVNSGFFSIPG